MKKVYVTPEIELDDFVLSESLCANMYPEFNSIGAGTPGGRAVSYESPVEDAGGEIRPTRPGRGS